MTIEPYVLIVLLTAAFICGLVFGINEKRWNKISDPFDDIDEEKKIKPPRKLIIIHRSMR